MLNQGIKRYWKMMIQEKNFCLLRQDFPKYPEAPAIPPGENEASCTQHIKLLQLENQKPSPDKHAVATLMSSTFAFRRREIIEQPKPIPQILKTYPSLKNVEQVCS